MSEDELDKRIIRTRMLVDQAWTQVEERLHDIDRLKELVNTPGVDLRLIDLELVRELACMVSAEIGQRMCDRILADDDFSDEEDDYS